MLKRVLETLRAGLIVSGVFLMIIGFGLTITLIGAILGIPIGFIGFIMVVVGLLTSGKKIVVVGAGAGQQQVVVMPSMQPQSAAPAQSSVGDGKFCQFCGRGIAKGAIFCSSCGKKQA